MQASYSIRFWSICFATGVGVGDPTTLIVQKTGKENENREKLKLEACAVDWAAQQLYWINGDGRKGKLVRSDFSGNTDTLIDEHGDYKKVRSMVVDQSITDQTYNSADSPLLLQTTVLFRVLYFAGDKTVGDVKIPQSGKVDRTKDFIGNDDNDNEKDSPISVALDDSTRKLYWIDGNDEYVNVYDLEEEESVSFDLQEKEKLPHRRTVHRMLLPVPELPSQLLWVSQLWQSLIRLAFE